MDKYETGISHSRSDDADLSRPDAVWLFPVGEVCGDGGVWRDGIPVLHAAEDGGNCHIRCAGTAVPAHLQDCAGTGDLECDRCGGGGFTCWTVRTGETA